MSRLARYAAGVAFALFSLQASAANTLPAPVNGITFDEWAAGNARLANQQSPEAMLKALGVSKSAWDQANKAFIKAMEEGDPRSYTFTRYGEVFANPDVGRFKGKGGQPTTEGKLTTFDDYARVQAHLTVAVEAGKNPQAVLEEHKLTVYEFSQASRPWVQKMASHAGSQTLLDMLEIRKRYESEYRKRYGVPEPDDEE